MKTIGIIGGMSWESTSEYYRYINEEAKMFLGGLHSAKMIVYSVDFDEVESLQSKGDWDALAEMMISAADRLAAGGAELLLIAANTMHKVANKVQVHSKLPLLHIADGVAAAISKQGVRRVLLLGTRFTMEEGFYIDRLQQSHDIEVVVPNETERVLLHRIILEELGLGDVLQSSQHAVLGMINRYQGLGVEGVILGCTELSLLISQQQVEVFVFDSLRIHARMAVMHAIPGLV
jgi:aspartate racemase